MPLYLGKEMISGISLGVPGAPGKSAYDAVLEANPELGLTEEEFYQKLADIGTAADQNYVQEVVDGLTAADVGARADNWMPTASDVGADPSGTAVNVVNEHNTDDNAHSDIRTAVSNAANAASAAQTSANNAASAAANAQTTAQNAQTTANGKAPMYTYGTTDLTAGTSPLATGQLHFVYE